ncbi:methyl-accepting chemotaxis protein [Nitrosococcus watsonii]|uniref:Methyl-accepting chemotaxis sensory transducer n=1 Tax=Nitrosococcus watsoni (strain C-113) TaxID=105559 RepID=D8K8A0_NITWC|nr:methyl-accepting chemotaxis protein [Nitrosococcus watsonii]ADJ27095.1 methyl-accepting chemotaxis sensory transducer [Nitrosococcus watsonii C-113]
MEINSDYSEIKLARRSGEKRMNIRNHIYLSALTARKHLFLTVITILLALTTIVGISYATWQINKINIDIKLGSEMRVLTQRFPVFIFFITANNKIKKEKINEGISAFDKKLEEIDSNDIYIPSIATAIEKSQQKIQPIWSQLKKELIDTLDTPQKSTISNLFEHSDNLFQIITGLVESYQNARNQLQIILVTSYAIGISTLILLLILFTRPIKTLRQKFDGLEIKNSHNQDAILKLLDEMGDLADGDLTVSATVTEDITGAIADSINYTIDALRTLVQDINDTAIKVSSSAQETQATVMHLADASEHQAQQITTVGAAINEMAVSIEQVSDNATKSAEVAKQSVEIAGKGTETVKNAIEGMDNIREQIQETSKRIKRLGESSQQIGEIVELINDIAEQTNILSLNAAIQAAMAGEAGRGFAVVADEVQRLAERSSNATKQIDALVKTIQSDTHEAIISMEESTSGVVSGAKLSQDAGGALGQIESVSHHLAELIQNISGAAKQQAAAAAGISDTMNVIQEITDQTSKGTNETASSIGRLSEYANEMRESVAGFKLPK